MRKYWFLILIACLVLNSCAASNVGKAKPSDFVEKNETPTSSDIVEKNETPAPPVSEEPEQSGEMEWGDVEWSNGSFDDGIGVIPPPAEVEIPKEEGITGEQRTFFFDFVQTYRVDAMPDFEVGTVLTPEDMKWFVANLCRYELTKDEKGNTIIPGAVLARVAKAYFGLTGAEYERDLPLGRSPFLSIPMAELTYYKEEQVGEKTIITARVFDHSPEEFIYVEFPKEYEFVYRDDLDYPEMTLEIYEVMKQDGCSFYDATRKLILDSHWSTATEGRSYVEFQYETTDGKTPLKFLYCKSILL